MNHFQRSSTYLVCALCLLLSVLFISESTYSHSISTPADITSTEGTPELVIHIDIYDDDGNFITHLHDWAISWYTQEEVDEIHANNPHTSKAVIESLPKVGDVKGVSQRTYSTPFFPSPDDLSEIGKPDPDGKYDNYGRVSTPQGGAQTTQQSSQDEAQTTQQQSSQDEAQTTQQSSQDEAQTTQQSSQDEAQTTQLPLPNLVVDSPQISKTTFLVVSIPALSKTVVDSGESFTLSVTVENTSESLSPEAILRYYRSSDVGVSGTEVGEKTVSPIAAMGSSDVSISLTAPDAPGTYLYYACISSNTDNTCTPHSVKLTVQGQSQDTPGAPSVVGMKFTDAEIERIEAQVALLVATNDRSPAAMQTLAHLRRLIAAARPTQTQLLANYPNPFNPETWIPYHLAKDADVSLTIYDLNGQVVRELALGHQAAGMYQRRSRAAYWDGKNAFGESVASGIYFYTFTAGEFTATRKMLIWK